MAIWKFIDTSAKKKIVLLVHKSHSASRKELISLNFQRNKLSDAKTLSRIFIVWVKRKRQLMMNFYCKTQSFYMRREKKKLL